MTGWYSSWPGVWTRKTKNSLPMKTGLFGGTFNPVHNGHIRTIHHVIRTYRLDRVFFIPCAQPPHKPDAVLASARDRFDLVKAAIEGFERMRISDLELNRQGPSYTIDTIRHFSGQFPQDRPLVMILGSDAFYEINTWKSFRQIFRQVEIIVMKRPSVGNSVESIHRFLADVISSGYRYHEAGQMFSHPELKQIYICNTPEIDISSTQIRARIKKGQPIADLVPGPCNEMILTKGLYL